MNRRAAENRPIDGLVLVDKPAGVTSHDVVAVTRRVLGTRRIGHTGTLDPFATGLLVLLVGHATRLLPYVRGEPKVYDAIIAFGTETDTDDSTGAAVRTAPSPFPTDVRRAIDALTGEIDQVPPAYSAKHVRGGRAYHAARRGEPVELAPSRVVVHRWDVHEIAADHAHVTITCGTGTYIRALARDLGRLSGSAAHLASLRRTRSGAFDVSDATSWNDLRSGTAVVHPALRAVSDLAVCPLTEAETIGVRQGRAVPASSSSSPLAALVDAEQRLVAIAERAGASWQPRVVIPDA